MDQWVDVSLTPGVQLVIHVQEVADVHSNPESITTSFLCNEMA